MDKLPATIDECHKVIKLLLDELSNLSKRSDAIEVGYKKLKIENIQFKERLNNNSSNSSLPPSSDFKKKKKENNRQSSGKKSGGQTGHKGYCQELLPIEQVDFIQNIALPDNCLCGGKINVTKNDYVRHQVHELPTLKLDVTEYPSQKGYCENCHIKHIARLPVGATWGITGPKLTSLMSDLTTEYGLSPREQQRFLEEHFQFRMSLGTVFNKQKIVNAAMESPVLELLPIIKKSSSVHSDETGHNRDGKIIGCEASFRHQLLIFQFMLLVEKKYYA